MKRKIRFSKRAIKTLESLFAFLEREWSLKVKNDFIRKLDKSLAQIQKLPDSFPKSEKVKDLRKCLVTKQTTIFYKYSDSSIDIVAIYDNRKNPNSLIKETKD